MATPTTLAAVLFVELADFSDLLSTDERAAVVVLSAYRRAVDPVIDEHHGDIVDSTGSELLVVFTSAVAAVQCALHLSLILLPFGAALGYPGKAEARIGVHLGEIWRDEGRVYGNGVNVAARVMQAAPAGALYLSEDVYRQVSGKLDLSVREVGGVELKNIDRPLALYEIDAGRGFVGPEALAARGTAGALATGTQAGVEKHGGSLRGDTRPPRDSARDGGERHARHDVPRGPSRDHLAAPPVPPLPPRDVSSGSTSRLANELRDSIKRDLREALASARMTPSETGLGFTIDIGSDAPAARKPEMPKAAVDLEAARERTMEKVSSSIKSLAVSGGIGAALGYGYFATGKWLFAAGAILAGLLPFLSNLKKLLAASAEIRLIDKREKRKSGGR